MAIQFLPHEEMENKTIDFLFLFDIDKEFRYLSNKFINNM